MSYEREMGRRREQHQGEAARGHQDLPLFASVSTMARRSDPATARQAAAGIAERLPALQHRVYAAFVAHGPMTAKVAERLPEFAALGFSTVRKRVSELHRAGLLSDTGRTEGGCTVYEAPECGGARQNWSQARR